MKKTIPLLSLFAAAAVYVPVALAQTTETTPKGPDVAPGETSDRTPEKKTETPDSQKTATPEGETSDRTPERHGEQHPSKDGSGTQNQGTEQ